MSLPTPGSPLEVLGNYLYYFSHQTSSPNARTKRTQPSIVLTRTCSTLAPKPSVRPLSREVLPFLHCAAQAALWTKPQHLLSATTKRLSAAMQHLYSSNATPAVLQCSTYCSAMQHLLSKNTMQFRPAASIGSRCTLVFQGLRA